MKIEDIFRRSRHLRRIVAAGGVEERDIEDVVQQTLEVAWAKRDQIDPTGSVRAWVNEIARNQARQYLRYRGAHPEMLVSRERPQDDVADDRPDPEVSAERAVRLRVLRGLIEQIHESRRELFAAYALGGVSVGELAAAYGIPTGTVRKRLRLAREDMCNAARRWKAAQKGRGELSMVPIGLPSLAVQIRALLGRCVEGIRRLGGTGPAVVMAAAVLIGGCVVACWPQDRLIGLASSGLFVPPVMTPPSTPRDVPPAIRVEDVPAKASTPVEAPRGASATRRRTYSPVEDDLIGRARAALGAGEIGEARSLLEEHSREFPDGQLADERDALLRARALH